MRGPARKGQLLPSLHYTLTLLSRGPRFYSASVGKIVQLERLGYVRQTGTIAPDGSREWAITEAGGLALAAHAEGGAG